MDSVTDGVTDGLIAIKTGRIVLIAIHEAIHFVLSFRLCHSRHSLCRGIDLKAQINTSSPMTVTHSSLVELCSLPSVTSGPPEQPAAFAHCKLTGKIVDVELEIENSRFSIDVFVTADDHPDISLGIDFLKKYQCAISFKDNSFIVGSGSAPVRSRLLLDREISLKYRGARCLAMSI
ncbi:hypothetical protein LSAT2_007892 [Lamellibrachia satsuma]|nr:hypothetical protein LSAT2_007892 [Lamellibrachia satsuma]